MHILKPDLFVSWDSVIKEWYRFQVLSDDSKRVSSEELYSLFLRKMHDEAKSLIMEKGNFLDKLNPNVIQIYKGNLCQARNIGSKLSSPDEDMNKKISSYEDILELMEKNGER